MDNKLANYLREHNIKYELHEHVAVFTVAESDKIKLSIPGLRTKSLFLKDSKNSKFYLVCLPGEKRLDIKKLQAELSTSKLQFASAEEMKERIGVSPGSASLFCMVQAREVVLILDKSIMESESAGFHPNVNTATLVLTKENIQKFYDSIKFEKHILEL